MAKSKLAPMKGMTIPRLELTAAVLAVEIDELLRRELRLDIKSSTFWTDSMTVIGYIRNTSRRFKTFVANRVSRIHDGSSVDQWRYVDTQRNPADHASRGLNAAEMVCCRVWLQGPVFLWKEETEWPVEPTTKYDTLSEDVEVKREVGSFAVKGEDMDLFNSLLNKYSCWYRLRRAVAWLIRFKSWLKGKRPIDKVERIQVDELKEAEAVVFKYLQWKHYSDEVQMLSEGAQIPKKSKIYDLEPYLDCYGVLRVLGRLESAPIIEDAKHQVIIPREHHVARLIVKQVHSKAGHAGKEWSLSSLRQSGYWIPGARTLINIVIRDCMTCKRVSGRLGKQRMADLPFERVTPYKPPFSFVGVDCFGPFFVKRGRVHEKRYGCLFTCLTIRAVHLEKLYSMDTSSFISALSRFVARRGKPEKIRSDQGTNFVGGQKEISEAVRRWNDTHKAQDHLLVQGIEWQYNPPAASHMGGSWERQIRTVRKVMNAILKEQVLDDERLDTIFSEVEAIVNSRPITPVSDSPKDLEALTPNHLLMLRSNTDSITPGKYSKQDMYGKRWRHVQFVAEQFWRRWVREYLTTIQLRSKWINKERNFRCGDLVLMLDESLPRNKWPLGRIMSTSPSKDGLVRSATVKTSTGEYVRPVVKLCLVEWVDAE